MFKFKNIDFLYIFKSHFYKIKDSNSGKFFKNLKISFSV